MRLRLGRWGVDSVAEIQNLFIAVVHRQPMRELNRVKALADRGLEGCIHQRPGGRRQVLLMDAETLEEFGLVPGVVKENLTTRGLQVRELRPGERLRAGDAVLEVTLVCEPCDRMEEIRGGLRGALRGKRGMLCRVVQSGMIRRGDRIEVLDFSKVSS